MMKDFHPLVFLLIATVVEVSGDAVIRMGLNSHIPIVRAVLFLIGAALLFGYGLFLNLAPLEFGQVVGLYIATLFIVWQIMSFVFFRAVPTVPILVGGAFVIMGGGMITFWKIP